MIMGNLKERLIIFFLWCELNKLCWCKYKVIEIKFIGGEIICVWLVLLIGEGLSLIMDVYRLNGMGKIMIIIFCGNNIMF